MRRLVALAGLGAALAGCAIVGVGKGPPSTASVRLTRADESWQVAPSAGSTATARQEVPQFGFVEGWGLVLATPRVLASFPNELPSRPGFNRTLEECKRRIELAAARQGGATVEAASLGAERQTDLGLYEGVVEVRIVYDFYDYYEVRQATLKCYSRPDGSLVDMRVVSPAGAGSESEVFTELRH